MKVTQRGWRCLPLPDPNDKIAVLSHLEVIGRTCYKSEDKITDESCIKFIESIRNRKHWAMLEHYIFVFVVPKWIFDDILDPSRMTPDNADLISKMPYINCTHQTTGDPKFEYMVSASATALNYLWECECYKMDAGKTGIVQICAFMKEKFPELMLDPNPDLFLAPVDPAIRFVDRIEMSNMDPKIRLIHDSQTYRMTVDRGVTHELVRHRPASWAQESTRYCNYGSGKFGGDITVLYPIALHKWQQEDNSRQCYSEWESAMNDAQNHYNMLVNEYGIPAQWARTVLPQSTKAEIVMTARMYEWKHFFNMRADKAAHPQMQEIAVPMLNDSIMRNPGLFDDLKYRVEELMDGVLYPD